MKSSEIRELSQKELDERLESEENILVRMRMNHAVSPLDNPNKIVETKKNIARLKTEMRARQLQEAKEQPAQVKKQPEKVEEQSDT